MNTFGEKLPPNNLVEGLLVRKKQLETTISGIEKFLEVAPAGRLRISTNKGTLQYYRVMPAKKKVLVKKVVRAKVKSMGNIFLKKDNH